MTSPARVLNSGATSISHDPEQLSFFHRLIRSMQLLENAGAIPYLQIRMYKKARQIKGDYYFSSFYDLFFYSFENNQLLFCCQNFTKKKLIPARKQWLFSIFLVAKH